MAPYGVENFPPDAQPYRQNLNARVICPDCKQDPPDLIEDNADLICANCGMVLADRMISNESEWRTFNSDDARGDDPNRVGEADNELLTSGNIGTTIAGGPNASKEARRIKRAQAMQQNSKVDKALTTAYMQVDNWGDQYNLTKVVKDTAKTYYKRTYEANTFRGKNIEAVLAACIFVACRRHNVGRTFAEIYQMTHVAKKELGRVYKALEAFLQRDTKLQAQAITDSGGILASDQSEYKSTQSTRPEVIIARFCNMLGLNFRCQSIAEALARKIPDIPALAGRSPLSTAAACIYFASHLLGFGKSTKQISDVAAVSDATIKHAYKFLLQEKDNLIQPEWLGPQAGTPKSHGAVSNLPSS